MQNWSHEFPSGACPFGNAIPTPELIKQREKWLRDGRIRGLTAKSQESNRVFTERLIWYLCRYEKEICDEDALGDFFIYLQEAHTYPEGRWGGGNVYAKRPLSRRSVRTYYDYLKVFFNYLVRKEVLQSSPLRRIESPQYQEDDKSGYTPEEFNRLLQAASESKYSKRNRDLLLFMIDAGTRESETCGLLVGDLDLDEQRANVMGKGQKRRSVYIGARANRALYDYLQMTKRTSEEHRHQPLFISERGGALTPSGLLRIYKRLGVRAGLSRPVNAHTMRHTFANEFLSAGAPIRDVQKQLGHTTPKMTMKYLYASDTSLRGHMRRYSPGDRMKKS